MNFLIAAAAPGRKRAQREPGAQILRAIRRARAELPQRERMTIDAGGDGPVQVCFKRGATPQPGG